MKNILFTIMALLIMATTLCAQQSEIITFSANEFSFSKSTVNNTVYDIISVSNGITDYSQPGAPQLPVIYLQFIVPRNKQVTAVNITSSQKQAIAGSFNIYPQQLDIPVILTPQFR